MVVPVAFAAWLDRQVDLQRLRSAAKGDPQLVAVLDALLFTAHYDRGASSEGRKLVATTAEAAPRLTVMSTQQAADVLGITGRAVRQACSAGRLRAHLVDGRYRITRADLDAHQSSKGPS